LGFRYAVVRISDGLIGAVDLRGELLTDGEARGIVEALLNAQTEDKRCKACDSEACAPDRLFCAFSELMLYLELVTLMTPESLTTGP